MKTLAITTLFTLLASALHAAPLQPGDSAPALRVAYWVKNGPVEIADGKGKNVYLVEFWATWCPPCRMSIPHLSKLQKEYASKGLVVVGITREALPTVKAFVAAQKDMEYNVAVDKNGETYAAYMKDAQGIPTAFIIGKKGDILWRGHPLQCDEVLKSVLNGTFDPAKQAKVSDLTNKLQLALQGQDIKTALNLSHAILEIDPDNQMAMRIALYGFKNDTGKIIAFLSDLIKRHPDSTAPYTTELKILNMMKDGKAIRTLIERYADNFSDDPGKLNTMAWIILDEISFGIQPLDISLKLSEKAVSLASKKSDKMLRAAYIDTLARCYYSVGRLDLAIETQKSALQLVADTKERDQLKQTLDFYEKTMKLGLVLKSQK